MPPSVPCTGVHGWMDQGTSQEGWRGLSWFLSDLGRSGPAESYIPTGMPDFFVDEGEEEGQLSNPSETPQLRKFCDPLNMTVLTQWSL